MSRHGQSNHNIDGRIGGDSFLSPLGEEYAKSLADFLEKQNIVPSWLLCVCVFFLLFKYIPVCLICLRLMIVVWSSNLNRTLQTSSFIQRKKDWGK